LQLSDALLVGRGCVLGAIEGAEPVRKTLNERRVHRGGQELSRIAPRPQLRREFDFAGPRPAGLEHLIRDITSVWHARLERHVNSARGKSAQTPRLGDIQ